LRRKPVDKSEWSDTEYKWRFAADNTTYMLKDEQRSATVHTPRRHFRTAGLAAFFLAFAAGCSHPTGQKTIQTQTVSGISVTMTNEGSTSVEAPPHSGDNVVVLDITDTATGQALNGANITATADMLAPRIAGQAVSGRSKGRGRYEVPIRLGIAAKYDLRVDVTPRGKSTVNFVFPIEAWQ